MRLGVHLPQNELGDDVVAIRDFVQTTEGLGYDYLIMGEHVLVHNPARHGVVDERPYTPEWVWHEPFTLFAYLAAITTRLVFMPSVLVLPQRQTVLAAKQAAEVAILSGGRLILAVGVGWSAPEFAALGQDFRTRGRRMEEQIEVMRRLWAEPLVRFDGRFERLDEQGLNPRPARPIPIWCGGMDDRVLDRIGRLCDGWSAQRTSFVGRPEAEQDAAFGERLERVHVAARATGRDPKAIDVGVAIDVMQHSTAELVAEAHRWERRGATHLALRTTHAGLTALPQHVEALRAFVAAYKGDALAQT